MKPKTKSNIIASVHLPGKIRFYVRRNIDGTFRVMRGPKPSSVEDEQTTAIAKMLRLAYFETKQTTIQFPGMLSEHP
jgi:hypothetical protein